MTSLASPDDARSDRHAFATTAAMMGIGGAILATLIVFALVPGLDPGVTALFHDSDAGFFVQNSDLSQILRDIGQITPIVLAIAAFALLLARRWLAWPRRFEPRALIACLVAILVGSVLVVNAGFKTYWDRPRPVQVEQFGGPSAYKPWWDPRGACERNCSFISGEASAAASTIFFALALPLGWRRRAVAAAIVFTVFVSGWRVAFGGHFLSDVMLGALVTILIGQFALRWWPILPDPALKPSAT